jgi:peptidoglycan hydrolase-like protein with peptidoglycan-binding domain
MKARSLATFLALSGVAVLPACSMFGGPQAHTAAATSPSSAATTPNYNAGQASATGTQTSELSPDMIRKVQQNLRQAGLYKGRVDGVWGPRTEAAVRDYQQQHNLNASGQLDQQTLDAMNLGTNNNPNNAANQNNANAGQQQPANQSYGTNNPAPNSNNGQANYNPPPPNNPNDQNNNNTNNGNNTPTTR